MLIMYEAVPNTWFSSAFSEPKISRSWESAYTILLLVFFAAGSILGGRLLSGLFSFSSSQVRTNEALSCRVPRWYVRGGLLVSLFAYTVWFGLGIYRAGSIEDLWATYLRDPFYVKFVLLRTLPGITTLTQVAVAVLPVMLSCLKLHRIDRLMVGTILLFAIARSFLHSERLALLELVVPIVFIVALRQSLTWLRIVKYGVAALATAVIFFIVNEMRRSFVYYGVTSLQDIVTMGFARFWGYYLTSINNMYLIFKDFSFFSPFYNTFSFIWRFPFLSDAYERLTGYSPIDMPAALRSSGLNPEFNTPTTLGALVLDFGLIGAMPAVFFLGVLSGSLHKLSRRGGIWLAFYAIWLVGMLEFMRIYYFASTRMFPTYLFFLGAVLLSRLSQSMKQKRFLYGRATHLRER